MITPAPVPLLGGLATAPDPRSRSGRRHASPAMLAAVRCAILCGARRSEPIAQRLGDQDIATAHASGFTRTPPCDAFSKLCIDLDQVTFEEAPACRAEASLAAPYGEAVRGSIGRHGGAIHLRSAMA